MLAVEGSRGQCDIVNLEGRICKIICQTETFVLEESRELRSVDTSVSDGWVVGPDDIFLLGGSMEPARYA